MEQEQKQESLEDNGDMISELPECLQSYILSKFTMKDLVKTRVLSKRWLKLWELRRNLVFDIPNMFDMDFSDLCELNGQMFMGRKYLGQITDELVRRVGKFMETFPSRKIDSLYITHYPGFAKYSDTVAGWFDYAISKDAEEIKLLSSSLVNTHCVLDRGRFLFPFWRLPASRSFKHLNLQRCILRLPPPSFAFRYLKSLQVKYSVVGYDFLASLLSNSLFLEVLCLQYCSLPDNLEICGPSLHHLDLTECLHTGNARISSTKLTVFEFQNKCMAKHTVFLNAPQLAKIMMHTGADDWLPPLMSQFTLLPLLENLNLLIFFEEKPTLPRNTALPPLGNLKQLELTFMNVKILGCSDLMWIVLLLKASPLLQKLTFRRVGSAVPDYYYENESERERWEPQEFTHNQLKEVEIVNCLGNWYETEFAIFMLETVQSLEQIVFNPSRRYNVGGGRWKDDEGFVPLDSHRHWRETGREIVLEKLQGKVPASTELVLL